MKIKVVKKDAAVYVTFREEDEKKKFIRLDDLLTGLGFFRVERRVCNGLVLVRYDDAVVYPDNEDVLEEMELWGGIGLDFCVSRDQKQWSIILDLDDLDVAGDHTSFRKAIDKACVKWWKKGRILKGKSLEETLNTFRD